MATRNVPAYWNLTDYDNTAETTLAGTLSGKPSGYTAIYNTTLSKIRVWNGSAFASVTLVDGDGGTYSAAAAASLTSAIGTYRNILECSGSHTAAKVAGTYGIGYGDPLAVSDTGTLYPLATIYIASADFQSVNGVAPKLRIRAQLYVNDVAPTGNFTFGLYPITRPGTSGAAGLCIYTIGTVVSGSNGASFTTPAADSAGTANGSDFAIPADGHYIIAVVTTATVATSSHVHVSAQLQLRNN